MTARPTLTSISKKVDVIQEETDKLQLMSDRLEVMIAKADKLSIEHSEICMKLGNHTAEHVDIIKYMNNTEVVFNAINYVVSAFSGLSTFIKFLKMISIWVLGPGIAAYIIYHVFFNQTIDKVLSLIDKVPS